MELNKQLDGRLSFVVAATRFIANAFFVPKALNPKRERIKTTPDEWGLNYEEITIQTRDKTPLAAWLVWSNQLEMPNKTMPMVIATHGHGKTLDEAPLKTATQFFASAGYPVLVYAARAHGKSGGVQTTIGGPQEVRDAEDVRTSATEMGYQPEIGYGVSMGAATLAQVKAFKLKILDSSYANLGVLLNNFFSKWANVPKFIELLFKDVTLEQARKKGFRPEQNSPIDAIRQPDHPPTLIFHSKNDPKTPYSDAESLYNAAGANTHLITADSEGHARLVPGYPSNHKQANNLVFQRVFRDFPHKYLEMIGGALTTYVHGDPDIIRAAIMEVTGQEANLPVIPTGQKTTHEITRNER